MKGGTKTWNISDEFLIESAEKRLDNGDYSGALKMLNRRAELYPPSADAWALYADIYEDLELWQLAADAWFRFLDVCNEADFPEGYEGLAVAFMNMGNDLQSAFYYSRAYPEDPEDGMDDLVEFLDHYTPAERPPELHIVGDADPEALKEGVEIMREGRLKEARERFLLVDEDSPDYPSAAGLAAMCLLMMGEEEEAEKECEALLPQYPDSIQALTTYVAVLDARGDRERAKKAASHLAELRSDATEDLYRIATALCETGLDEDAFRVLTELRKRLPYDDTVLFFYAVAAYHVGKVGAAISSLETLTAVFPRKVIAGYYLRHLRRIRDGEEEKLDMNYFYRLPQEEYGRVGNYLLSALRADDSAIHMLAGSPELQYCFRAAFDELEGRDENLQMIAIKVAARTRNDDFLREQLLDYTGNDLVKFSILHELTVRNEENSFGTVFLNLYREFFTHTINIGSKKAEEFLAAFADVYSKYGLLGEDNEGKLCAAAEDIYIALENACAWHYMDERAALASAIYREARLPGSLQSLKEICEMYDADRYVTEEILDYLM